MQSEHLDRLLRALKPVLKDHARAQAILQRYWKNRIALVWEIEQIHRAANERCLALTNKEARAVLQELLEYHNPQYGICDFLSCSTYRK